VDEGRLHDRVGFRPARDDPFAAREIPIASAATGVASVECDHPAIRGVVIAFVTERSSGRGASGFSFWANPRARRGARTAASRRSHKLWFLCPSRLDTESSPWP
jgi:hypothetical protein